MKKLANILAHIGVLFAALLYILILPFAYIALWILEKLDNDDKNPI